MRMSLTWSAAVLTAGGLALGAASAAAAAPAGRFEVRTAGGPVAGPAASLPVPGALFGVTAVSSGNAWAIGSTGSNTSQDRPLLAHWNGTDWRTDSSPALPSRVPCTP